ncbi:MAG TPA: alpha-L-fucosidase, partial [bacterium]|nr:alpha-L-fucosidase [bacterium]
MASRLIPKNQYRKIARDFNPVAFDARAWAELAVSAGMKYLVITAKHHDGFSMYRTKLSDYNIYDATPFQRDPLAELAEACRDVGLRFGIYYSQLDWNWGNLPAPLGFISNYPRYLDFLKKQLRELLTGYGEISAFFFDGDWMAQWSMKDGRDVERMCRELQPGIIINDRVGKRTIMDSFVAGKPLAAHMPFMKIRPRERLGDYVTPEQYVPGSPPEGDWETCMTMNTSWGYKSFDNDWKSAGELVSTLVGAASGGGNLLLNIGPDGNGRIPTQSVTRLKEIGAWLNKNGDCIYGTKPWRKSSEGSDIRYTEKNGNLFAIIRNLNRGNIVRLVEPVASKDTRIVMLSGGRELKWKHDK